MSILHRILRSKASRIAAILGVLASSEVAFACYGVDRTSIGPRETITYRSVYAAGTRATVHLTGSGLSDLDCFVYDAGGNLVDQDTNGNDQCNLSWVPLWTDSFRVVVTNQNGWSNSFIITTN